MATDGIKPLQPVWPARPADSRERDRKRREPPHREHESPAPPRKDDDKPTEINEYA